MNSIRGRIVTLVLIVIVIEAIVGVAVSDRVYRRILDTVAADTVQMVSREYEALKNDRIEVMTVAVDLVMENPDIVAAFEARDRAALQAEAYPLYERLNEKLGISRLYFFDSGPDSTVFLRPYSEDPFSPDYYGDRVTSEALYTAYRTGEPASGLEHGRRALSLRVFAPCYNDHGALVGIVGVAETIDDHLATITGATGNHYALFMDKRGLERDVWIASRLSEGRDADWDAFENVVLIESTLPVGFEFRDEHIGRTRIQRAESLGYMNLGSTEYVAGVFPLEGAHDHALGYVYVLHNVDELSDSLRNAQLGLVGSFVILTVLAAVLAGAIVNRTVSSRLGSMVERVERLSLSAAAGRWDELSYSVPTDSSDDEIGRFERYFAEFMRLVAGVLKGRESSD